MLKGAQATIDHVREQIRKSEDEIDALGEPGGHAERIILPVVREKIRGLEALIVSVEIETSELLLSIHRADAISIRAGIVGYLNAVRLFREQAQIERQEKRDRGHKLAQFVMTGTIPD